MWRRFVGLVGVITVTVMVTGASPASAAVESQTAAYAPVAPATTMQMQADARIIAKRLHDLGASFVHVAVSHGDIVLSSAGRAITVSLFDEVGRTAQMYFRPVLCYAYPQAVPKGSKVKGVERGIGAVPACSSASELTSANLDINTSTGEPSNNIEPDSQYEAYPSTSVDKPNYAGSTVLLPGIGTACDGTGFRCVLGPSEMSGHSIASAQATQNQTGEWVVDYTLAGSARLRSVGQGGPGELPPVARDRARRRGVLGAHHPADAVEFHVLRRPG